MQSGLCTCGAWPFLPVTHTIEFRFEPQSYIIGNQISVWAAIITYLLLIARIAVLAL